MHGPLAREFGAVWNLDIASPAEVVRAIECGRPGFTRRILDLDQRGMVFRVRTSTHEYGDDDLTLGFGSNKQLDIIPVVRGASAGIRFVVGAVLVVASFAVAPATAPYLLGTGASLMLGAVAEWLAPVPKPGDFKKNVPSWTLDGASNLVDQGLPVPVIYGEVLTGGYTISAGLAAVQVSPTGALAPAVTIGGRLDNAMDILGTGVATLVIPLSASPINLVEPYGFSWSISGFTGAAARRLVDLNKATLKLELDYDITTEGEGLSDTGSVTVLMTGIETSSSSGANPQTVTVQATENMTITVGSMLTPASIGAGA